MSRRGSWGPNDYWQGSTSRQGSRRWCVLAFECHVMPEERQRWTKKWVSEWERHKRTQPRWLVLFAYSLCSFLTAQNEKNIVFCSDRRHISAKFKYFCFRMRLFPTSGWCYIIPPPFQLQCCPRFGGKQLEPLMKDKSLMIAEIWGLQTRINLHWFHGQPSGFDGSRLSRADSLIIQPSVSTWHQSETTINGNLDQ